RCRTLDPEPMGPCRLRALRRGHQSRRPVQLDGWRTRHALGIRDLVDRGGGGLPLRGDVPVDGSASRGWDWPWHRSPRAYGRGDVPGSHGLFSHPRLHVAGRRPALWLAITQGGRIAVDEKEVTVEKRTTVVREEPID